MKILIKIVQVFILTIHISFFFSCQKDEGVGTVGIAKVNVINAVVASGNVKANVGIKPVYWSSIANDQVLGGTNPLGRLYITPTDKITYLQAVQVSDTTKLWYNQQKQLSAGKMYTLYLSGTPENVKTSFHEETKFPKYILRDASRPTPMADSLVNIRFVNLSPSGPAVDIKMQGMSTNEVSSLSYEGFTDFKAYSATEDVDQLAFEIRKSSSKELIKTYYLYVPNVRFKSIAIMMLGIYPGAALPSTDQYRIAYVAYQ